RRGVAVGVVQRRPLAADPAALRGVQLPVAADLVERDRDQQPPQVAAAVQREPTVTRLREEVAHPRLHNLVRPHPTPPPPPPPHTRAPAGSPCPRATTRPAYRSNSSAAAPSSPPRPRSTSTADASFDMARLAGRGQMIVYLTARRRG